MIVSFFCKTFNKKYCGKKNTKLKNRPIMLLHSPFGGQAVLTTTYFFPIFTRCSSYFFTLQNIYLFRHLQLCVIKIHSVLALCLTESFYSREKKRQMYFPHLNNSSHRFVPVPVVIWPCMLRRLPTTPTKKMSNPSEHTLWHSFIQDLSKSASWRESVLKILALSCSFCTKRLTRPG